MTTALATQERADITIIEQFGLDRPVENDQEMKFKAAAFIVQRRNHKAKITAELIRLTIEEGLAYQHVYDNMPEGDSWEAWVKKYTPYDPDTARNFRNVASRFLEIVQDTPDEVLNRMNRNALYQLAVNTVSIDAGLWFFQKLLNNMEIKGDKKLALIATDSQIRDWLDKNLITANQATALVEVLKRIDPKVAELCRDHIVKEAGVCIWLNNQYMAWASSPDDVRPDKTWHELKQNLFHLAWEDSYGDTRVHIGDANPSDCRLYMQARSKMHALSNGNPATFERATFEIKVRNGRRYYMPLDDTILHPDIKSGTILFELLPDTYKA